MQYYMGSGAVLAIEGDREYTGVHTPVMERKDWVSIDAYIPVRKRFSVTAILGFEKTSAGTNFPIGSRVEYHF